MSRWNEIGRWAVANSVSWFPDVHDDGPVRVVVHFTLGLIGEVGEFAEAHTGRDLDAVAGELADVLTYSVELGYSFGLDLDGLLALPADPDRPLLVFAGRLANAVTKLDRYDMATPVAWRACVDTARPALVGVIRDALSACAYYGLDPEQVVRDKQAVCVERWGRPDHDLLSPWV